MAPSFLYGSRGRRSAKFFDVRLDADYVVFRGHEEEASSAHLRGKLVLCLSDPLTIKDITLTLKGVSKVAHPFVGVSKKNVKERGFLEKKWTFRDAGKGKTETLGADNYEFPFDIVLEGSLPESVEGLPETFVIYRFRAVIRRKHGKDLVIHKPLRIIRTLNPNALEVAHAMSVSNIWPNKLDYTIGTPSKAVMYGTSIETEFRLKSLLKGLKISTITAQILENQEFDVGIECSLNNPHQCTRVVAEDIFQVPEDAEILHEEVEGFRFSRHIELPKSLTKCLQDVETRGIKVRHRLKFNVQLHNPDNHISELRVSLPVALYISPSLAINENHELVDRSPIAARRAVEDDITHRAPPLYGDHQLDQLYSEVELRDYHTPGNFSSAGTPMSALSRNVSSENVSSSDPPSAGVPATAANFSRPVDVSAAALRGRLQNLRSQHVSRSSENSSHNRNDDSPSLSRRGSIRNRPVDSDQPRRSYSANGSYRSRSITPSRDRSHSLRSLSRVLRRTSDDDHIPAVSSSSIHTPPGGHLEIEDLSRVPSYSVAIRSRSHTPVPGPSLPSYLDATSSDSILVLSSSPSTTLTPSAIEDNRAADHPTITLQRAASTSNSREQHSSRPLGEVQTDERPVGLMQAIQG